MKIFLDTEFSGFQEDPKLISIALVAEDGRELYVELEDWGEDDCDEFVIDHVIPGLEGIQVSESEARELIVNFLDGVDSAEICTDAPAWDFMFLKRLIGSAWPAGVARFAVDVSFLAEHMDSNTHHALEDARMLMSEYKKRFSSVIDK